MAILAEHMNRNFLAVDERRGELLRLLAEGLAFLRTVDAAQTDAFRLTIVQDVDVSPSRTETTRPEKSAARTTDTRQELMVRHAPIRIRIRCS